MGSVENETILTVQGRDTPVPADGSAKAGSSSSSTNDCSFMEVDHLAPTKYTASREDTMKREATGNEEQDPFRRKSCIARTPPRARLQSCPDAFAPEVSTWEKRINTSKIQSQKAVDADRVIPNASNIEMTKEQTGKTPAGDQEATALFKELEKAENRQQILFEKMGKGIKTMDGIVSNAKNIHKTIRGALNDTVLLYNQMKDNSAAIEEIKSAIRRANVPRWRHIADREIPTKGSPTITARSLPAPEGTNKKRGASTSPMDEGKREQKKRMGKREDTRNGAQQHMKAAQVTRKSELDEKESELHGGQTENKSEWRTVDHHKAKRKKDGWTEGQKQRKRKMLPEAIAVAVSAGTTYADVIRHMRNKVDPSDVGAEISMIRRTKAGEILVELKKGGSADTLRKTLVPVLEGKATVKTLSKLYTLQIRDLDETVTKEDILEAIKLNVGESDAGGSKVYSLRRAYGGMQVTVVGTPAKCTEVLLKTGKIKIGWVRWRVRETAQVTRCYKCLGFGHVATGCRGPSRAYTCWKSGKEGHKAKECQEKNPDCVLCA